VFICVHQWTKVFLYVLANNYFLISTNVTGDQIGAQGRTKFAWSKFEHLRLLQMARRANYMEVIRNLTGVPVRVLNNVQQSVETEYRI